jgi:hypothetical protein
VTKRERKNKNQRDVLETFRMALYAEQWIVMKLESVNVLGKEGGYVEISYITLNGIK